MLQQNPKEGNAIALLIELVHKYSNEWLFDFAPDGIGADFLARHISFQEDERIQMQMKSFCIIFGRQSQYYKHLDTYTRRGLGPPGIWRNWKFKKTLFNPSKIGGDPSLEKGRKTVERALQGRQGVGQSRAIGLKSLDKEADSPEGVLRGIGRSRGGILYPTEIDNINQSHHAFKRFSCYG